QTAVEAAHAQAVEEDLHAFANAARRRATKLKGALHVARPIGVRRRIIEERVPPASALAGLALIEGARAADNGFAAGPDGRYQRLCGIERERRAPDAGGLIRPGHGHRVFAADDADWPRPYAREIERHRHTGRLQRDEDQSCKEGAAYVHGGADYRSNAVIIRAKDRITWRAVEKPLSFAARCQMRLLAALVLCSIVTLPAVARNAARASDDDAAIREVVRKYVDAREKRDP